MSRLRMQEIAEAAAEPEEISCEACHEHWLRRYEEDMYRHTYGVDLVGWQGVTVHWAE